MKSIVNIIGIILILALIIVPRISMTPIPTPTPNPPTPIVVKTPLRVLVAYDSKKVPTWVADQQAILTDTDVAKYLTAYCPIENGQPAYRIYDENTDINTSPAFKPQLDVAKASGKDPSVTITTGNATNVYDLPANKAAMITLLESFE